MMKVDIAIALAILAMVMWVATTIAAITATSMLLDRVIVLECRIENIQQQNNIGLFWPDCER